MEALVNNIITDVRKTIDDIAPNDSEFESGQDFAELGTLVKAKLCEAVDYVHGAANIERMQGDASTIVHGEKNGNVFSGYANVEDMLRFCYAKVSTWQRPVTDYVLYGTSEHAAAMDTYAGASIYRPVVVLIPSWVDIETIESEDVEVLHGKRLQFLPSISTASADVCYIKKCEIGLTEDTTSQEYVIVDGGLYEALINYLSGLVLMVMNDDRGENLIALAKNEIGAETK